MFGFAHRRSTAIKHDEWPARRGRSRILLENPDGAELWVHADILREAGYDVASCSGPRTENGRGQTVCPLVSGEGCPLAAGADVVVSTTRLTDSREIIATLRAGGSPAVLVEGTQAELEQASDAIGDAPTLTLPINARELLTAVEQILPSA